MSIPENNAGAAVPHTITHAAIQHPIALPAAVVHPAAAVPAAALAPGTMLTKPLFSAPLLSAAQAAHLALPPAQPPASALVSRMNLRRIPATIDPIGVAAQGHEPALQPFRLAAAAKIFGGLQRMQQHVGAAMQVLQRPKLPPKLVGALHQPDGTAAARVQVQFQPASVGLKGAAETVLTADDGGFTLNIPIGATLPSDGLPLTIH
ncbi:MAG: hypothetical protein JO061_05595, partial [Acidobacteriaceae bacterium]|nr:hypothetical protein [Acidobacteriaceae bacterium]